MNPQAMENLYNDRLQDIETVINIQSDGNDDLNQEGLLGAYLALQKEPTAKDRFLLNKARWRMISYIRRGRSVDNGFYKRKTLKVVHYNQLPADDKIFSAFIGEYGQDPVDEQAIFRISIERLFQMLSNNEILYIKYKTMEGLPDVRIKQRMGISFPHLYKIKRNIRREIESFFAA